MSAVRHLASTKARVIELYDAGWRQADIERLLAGEGTPVPSRNTMWVWTHPEKARRQQQRDLAVTRRWRLARASFGWPGVRGPEWLLGRMSVLDDAGLSANAIAKVMHVDFPTLPELGDREIWDALRKDRLPHSWRTHFHNEERSA